MGALGLAALADRDLENKLRIEVLLLLGSFGFASLGGSSSFLRAPAAREDMAGEGLVADRREEREAEREIE